jgi:AhpD family alkylhydroperoxidase
MKTPANDCACQDDQEACTCRKDSDEEVLARLTKTFGKVPPPFPILAQRPGALSAFFAYRDELLEKGPLSVRDRALVMLTTAVALRLSFCIEKSAKRARAAGVSQEEIVQAALIASLQSANSMVLNAYEGLLPE